MDYSGIGGGMGGASKYRFGTFQRHEWGNGAKPAHPGRHPWGKPEIPTEQVRLPGEGESVWRQAMEKIKKGENL